MVFYETLDFTPSQQASLADQWALSNGWNSHFISADPEGSIALTTAEIFQIDDDRLRTNGVIGFNGGDFNYHVTALHRSHLKLACEFLPVSLLICAIVLGLRSHRGFPVILTNSETI